MWTAYIYLRHGDGLKATSFVCTTDLIEDILRRCGIASYEWQSIDEACSLLWCAHSRSSISG